MGRSSIVHPTPSLCTLRNAWTRTAICARTEPKPEQNCYTRRTFCNTTMARGRDSRDDMLISSMTRIWYVVTSVSFHKHGISNTCNNTACHLPALILPRLSPSQLPRPTWKDDGAGTILIINKHNPVATISHTSVRASIVKFAIWAPCYAPQIRLGCCYTQGCVKATEREANILSCGSRICCLPLTGQGRCPGYVSLRKDNSHACRR
ncbi:hypothetical protein BDU57DRAFT_6751 [Ampelomyces quisqualis]|uniref:Uncharacterized protein n=1 Tax=Ampelomyces quisqualis TaxID=50730 RepID=A0A6A5QY56_AMPQU|nr:hypothetical protein BDU57DRAFT_6751 [Ampelomyces quisqualis]